MPIPSPSPKENADVYLKRCVATIVGEYDEPAHYNNAGQLKQKDVLRQQRIITHLGCKFFRYNERTKELYEVKTSMTN